MATTIKLKSGSGAPLAGDLVAAEPALDLTNKRLYTEDSGGTVIEVGTNPSTLTVDTDVLVVDATNNRVGIGTTGPEKPLDVTTSSTGESTLIRINNDATDGTAGSPTVASIEFGNSGTAKASIAAAVYGNDWLAFRTNSNTERMRIDASGNVGIGTTSPSAKLDISGAAPVLELTDTGSTASYGWQPTSNDLRLFDFNASLERLRITSSGNVGIGATAPIRLSGGKYLTLDNASETGIELGINGVAHGELFASGNDVYLANRSANSIIFRTNGANERMRIDSSGNVMIKNTTGASFTLNAATDLSIGSGSANAGMTIYTGGSNQGAISFADGTTGDQQYRGYIVYTHSTDVMNFGTAGTERMRIDSSGNLLVGTTGLPIANGKISASSSGNTARFEGTTLGLAALSIDKSPNDSTTSQVFAQFTINGQATGSGQINANGASQAAFGSFSDRRLKENIVDLPKQLTNIVALRPVEFDYIASEGGGHQLGFIAQEVEEIYPDLVGERADGMKTLTGIGKMEARLIKAIQEQQEIINDLRARVAQLEEA